MVPEALSQSPPSHTHHQTLGGKILFAFFSVDLSTRRYVRTDSIRTKRQFDSFFPCELLYREVRDNLRMNPRKQKHVSRSCGMHSRDCKTTLSSFLRNQPFEKHEVEKWGVLMKSIETLIYHDSGIMNWKKTVISQNT